MKRVKAKREVAEDLFNAFYEAMIKIHEPGLKIVNRFVKEIKLRGRGWAQISIHIQKTNKQQDLPF